MAITTGTNGNNTLNGTGTGDKLFGLGGNDKLNGLGGNDTLDGGAGNDTLDGGAGNDRVIGGAGNDTYIVTATSGTDVFVEVGAGGGTDTVRSSRTNFTLGAHIENLVLTGSGNINGTGNVERNKLTGNTGNNKLFGKDGIDTLEGGAGNDTLDGGAANDRLVGGGGNDVYIVGSAAATGTDTIVEAAGAGGGTDTVRSSRTYTLGANIEKLVLTGSGNLNGFGNGSANQITGNGGNNKLSGLGGNDNLDGGSGNDSLVGGEGNDTLHGGAGTDTLVGGAGDDTYIVDDALDTITEAVDGGIDTIVTEFDLGPIVLEGTPFENLTFLGSLDLDAAGSAGANVLTGNSGANQLDGGDGADTLDGGAGADSLFGGTGTSNDVLIWDMDDDARDGGDGTDTLLVTSGTDAVLDSNITAIEKIGLAGNASVTLTPDDINGVFGGTVTIEGGAGGSVHAGGGWSIDTIGGGYAVYTKDGATLVVDVDIDRDGIGVPELDSLSLDGTNGFTVGASGGSLGRAVAAAGDVNGDGFDDFIVGAPDIYYPTAGAAYVIFGHAGGFVSALDPAALNGTNGFAILGTNAADHVGAAVSAAGDVNGDGIADLIIGAPYSGNGEAYVVFGSSAFGSAFNVSALDGTNGFTIESDSGNDNLGRSVSAADLNGDGLTDLIVGDDYTYDGGPGPGVAYVIFGASTFDPVMGANSVDGGNGFRVFGQTLGDDFGFSVSRAGDVNGDGIEDFIVGARESNVGDDEAGSSYVVFGHAGGFDPELALDDLESNGTGFAIHGTDSYEHSGHSVAAAGDVNGDGLADIIIGAPIGDESGVSYVVFGSSDPESLETSQLNGSNGFVIIGAEYAEGVGTSVSSAGDFNGDGYDDLVIGVHHDSGDTELATYVVFGASSFDGPFILGELDGINGFRLTGIAADDAQSVSGGRDLNGDGFADLIVGQQQYNDAYVIFGHDTGHVTHLGTAGPETLTGTAGADVIVAGAGNDTLIGAGGSDVFHAGAGDDRIVLGTGEPLRVDGGAGTDTVALDGFGGGILLDGIQTSNVRGIEIADLSGTHANTLVVTKAGVLNLSDTTNTLVVTGNANDTVTLAGDWTLDTVAGGMQQWVNGNARAHIAEAVTVQGDTLSLDALNGAAGFTVRGTFGSGAGNSVNSAGDVDGDGRADFIIGAPNYYGGDTYVVYGKALATGSALDLSALTGTQGFRIDSSSTSNGYSVGGLGDVNGDGFADVISGAYNAYGATGQTYVVFGASALASSFSAPGLNGTNGFTLNGIDGGEFSGAWVSSAGDVNADGYDDILVGANNANGSIGRTYLVFGTGGGFASALSLAEPGVVQFNGIENFSGRSVAAAGDFNGDGYDDFIIGVGDSADECYVVFGKAGGFASAIDLSALDGTDGFRIEGPDGSGFGRTVASAGDFNADGLSDLIIGANTFGGDPDGAAYVIYGTTDAQDPVFDVSGGMLSGDGIRFDGSDEERAGHSVASAGDFNGDGYDDVIIGAPNAGPDSGTAYIVYGKAGGFGEGFDVDLESLDASSSLQLTLSDNNKLIGRSVASAGDINGDGFDDVVVGSPRYAGHYVPFPPYNGYDGAVYVIYGGNRNGAVDFLGGTGADTLTGSAAAEAFVGGRGNDVLVGGGGADAFHGGAGNDVITIGDSSFLHVDGGAGFDTLRLGSLDFDLSFSGAGGTRVSGIEAVDMRGNGDGDFELSLADLHALSDTSNVLTVEGDTGDEVFMLTTDGWTDQSTAGGYHTWTHGAATLKVDENVAVYFET